MKLTFKIGWGIVTLLCFSMIVHPIAFVLGSATALGHWYGSTPIVLFISVALSIALAYLLIRWFKHTFGEIKWGLFYQMNKARLILFAVVALPLVYWNITRYISDGVSPLNVLEWYIFVWDFLVLFVVYSVVCLLVRSLESIGILHASE